MLRIVTSRLGIAFGLMVLAGSLRFYRLGDWPFTGDETATLQEVESLFSNGQVPEDGQIYRLPRAIPLSALVHHLGNTLFGRDEFGSRVMMALLGTASVGVAFFLLEPLRGRPSAIATALLVALWPEHILQSQYARFYIVAAFFSSLCMLVGAFVARRRSARLCLALCCLIMLAILCHTLMGALLGILFAGILAASYAERRPLPKDIAMVFLGAALVVVIFFVAYLRPLLHGWNSSANWGYGVVHSVLASVNMVGWPIALLGAMGLLLLLRERGAQDWYWVTCAAGWAVTSVTFPLMVAYHPEYVFPLAISILVLAGGAVGTIYEGLRARGVPIGAAWIGLACLGNLPSLVSHYRDGSRTDMRTAARYVEQNWRSGDRVTGYAMGLFNHYGPDCKPAIPLSSADPVSGLRKLADGPGRLWIVLDSSRSGLPEDLSRWLGTHCSHELRVRRARYDYADYSLDIYLSKNYNISIHNCSSPAATRGSARR